MRRKHLADSSRSARGWIAVCAPDPDPGWLAEMGEAIGVVGEPGWVEEAVREGLGPLLYWRLTAAARPVNLPERIRQAFWRSFAGQSARTRSLVEVLDGMGRAAVAAAPLGGSWLAEEVYPHAVLRPHAEMEFLVSPVDLDRARGVMVELGFSSIPARPGETSCCFERRADTPRCRMHWALGRSEIRFPGAEELLAESSPVQWRESSCFDLPSHLHLSYSLARLQPAESGGPPLLPMLDVPWIVSRFGRGTLERALMAASGYGWRTHAVEALDVLRDALRWDSEERSGDEAVSP